MKVERIIKRSDATASVIIDDQSELILSYEVIVKNGLRKDDEISESLFSLLKEENEKYFIRKKALELLARRIHSSKELQIKLLQKRLDKKSIAEVIKNLCDNKIIDDEAFAQIFVEEKSRTKQWSKSKLKLELIKRGIQKDIIDNALSSPLLNDKEEIQKLAAKKLNVLKKRNYPNRQLRQKLFSFLLSKGFDYESINSCTQELFLENEYDLID